MRAIAAFLAALLVPATLAAHSEQIGEVLVGHIWAPPSQGDTAEVYVPLLNRGEAASFLVGAESPRAERVTLQESDTGTAKDLERIELPPNRPVSLREGGLHLRLEGVQAPLEGGDRIPIRLQFEPEGTVEIDIFVETAPGH